MCNNFVVAYQTFNYSVVGEGSCLSVLKNRLFKCFV